MRQRLTELDGLRGIAALIVYIAHGSIAIDPKVYGVYPVTQTPLFVFWNASFAVELFFVLSGFVIARSAMSARHLPTTLVARYLRLTIPITASVILAWSMFRIFPGAATELGRLTENPWLIGNDAPAGPFIDAIWEGAFRIYDFWKSTLNPVLWTMYFELYGSMAIYVLYRLVTRQPIKIAALCGALLFYWSYPNEYVFFCDFAAGALIYELWQSERKVPAVLAMGCLVAGLYLGGYSRSTTSAAYAWLQDGLATVSVPDFRVRVVGAAVLLTGVVYCRPAGRFLRMAPARFLGRISFALYLVHFPVLLAGMSALTLAFGVERWWSRPAALVMSTAAVFMLATAMTWWLDEPVVRWLSRLRSVGMARLMLSRRPRQPVTPPLVP